MQLYCDLLSTCEYVNLCRDICIEMKENIVVMWLIILDSSNVTSHVSLNLLMC